jgi:hypothetical protein
MTDDALWAAKPARRCEARCPRSGTGGPLADLPGFGPVLHSRSGRVDLAQDSGQTPTKS